MSPLAGTGLRTVTGVYNNLLDGQEHYGAADQPFPRRLSKSFGVADPLCTGPVAGPTSPTRGARASCATPSHGP